MTDTPKPQPEPLICRLYDVLAKAREYCGSSWLCEEMDTQLAAARPLMGAIRSGELTPVEVWLANDIADDPENGGWAASVSSNEARAREYFMDDVGMGAIELTRATVYARKPRPVEVSEGWAEVSE